MSDTPHPLDPIMATMGLCPACEAHFRKTFLAGLAQTFGLRPPEAPLAKAAVIAIGDEVEATRDLIGGRNHVVHFDGIDQDETREDRNEATRALARIWDIFPVGDDANDVRDDDISHEPLIRRARMAADKLTAARAEVRGLHAALDQLRTELDKAASERDEALEKLAKDAVARDNALAARLERTNLASR